MKQSNSVLFVAAVAALSSFASAAVIAPGQTAFAVNENNPVGGTVVATQVSAITTANYTGFLTSKAISGDTSNIYGGLTFVYSVSNDSTSANAITRLSANGFASYVTDMSYKLGTGTVAPTINDRVTADVIGFSFLGAPVGSGVLAAGTTTEDLVVQTNATQSLLRLANVSNGAVSSVFALTPAGAISPEPATLASLAGLGLMFRRRR